MITFEIKKNRNIVMYAMQLNLNHWTPKKNNENLHLLLPLNAIFFITDKRNDMIEQYLIPIFKAFSHEYLTDSNCFFFFVSTKKRREEKKRQQMMDNYYEKCRKPKIDQIIAHHLWVFIWWFRLVYHFGMASKFETIFI